MLSKKIYWSERTDVFAARVNSSLMGTESGHIRELLRSDVRGILDKSYTMSSDSGTATISPSRVLVDRHLGLTLKFYTGNQPLEIGAHLAVLLPEYWGGIVQEFDPGTYSITPLPGEVRGYIGSHVNAIASDPAVRLEGTLTTMGSVHTVLDLVVMDKPLTAGGEISILLGDPIGQMPLTIEFAGHYKFAVLVDRLGSCAYRRVDPFPEIEVVADLPSSLSAIVRNSQPENDVKLRVIANDRLRNRNYSYAGSPRLFLDGDAERSFTSPHLTDIKPGIHRVTVSDLKRGISGRSDPFVVGPWVKEGTVYFGDLHFHTELSDGVRTLDEAISYGRDERGLDFIAPGDHFEPLAQPGYYYPKDERWQMTMAAIKRHHADGEFVSLLAYELGTWYHRNVIFRTSEGKCMPRQPDDPSPQKIWDSLDSKNAFTMIHQTKYQGKAAWGHHDDAIERLAEIYSTWGSSEADGEASVQAGLNLGHRLGIVCGTDTHTGRPGIGNRTFYGCGIAAVVAPDLTREAIWQALYNRSCYGTTGARILLDFRLNTKIMGSELSLAKGASRYISVRVVGSEHLTAVEVIKNGHVLFEKTDSLGEEFNLDWEEPRRSMLEKMKNPFLPKTDYYYLRVSQADGHQAWSSPIWVDDN